MKNIDDVRIVRVRGWAYASCVALPETIASKLGLSAASRALSGARERWRRGAAGVEADRVHVLHFATGLRQAYMAVREAVGYYQRGNSVLVDPIDWTLSDTQAELVRNAERTVNEAEARLARAQVILGFDSRAGRAGREAIAGLREAFDRLVAYVQQPGEGESWSEAELDAAGAALTEAEAKSDEFLRAVARR